MCEVVGGCLCSIDEDAAVTRCVCFYHKKTPQGSVETSPLLIECTLPSPKRRAKRAILPVANPLPASESEEGDRPKPKTTAPMNGKHQLLRARRATLEQLYRSHNADIQAANASTGCYKPDWCDCQCKPVGAKDQPTGYDCLCVEMPEWSCAVKKSAKCPAITGTYTRCPEKKVPLNFLP